jgi:hypothetical protein
MLNWKSKMKLLSFRGAQSASFDAQLRIGESILTVMVMDSGPACFARIPE